MSSSAVWAQHDEFAKLLASIHSPSGSKLSAVSSIAVSAHKYYKHVVHAVEKYIKQKTSSNDEPENASGHHHQNELLSGLYMIDCIVRASKAKYASKDQYQSRFQQNLVQNTKQTLVTADSTTRSKIAKLIGLWRERKMFDDSILDELQQITSGITPSSSNAATANVSSRASAQRSGSNSSIASSQQATSSSAHHRPSVSTSSVAADPRARHSALPSPSNANTNTIAHSNRNASSSLPPPPPIAATAASPQPQNDTNWKRTLEETKAAIEAQLQQTQSISFNQPHQQQQQSLIHNSLPKPPPPNDRRSQSPLHPQSVENVQSLPPPPMMHMMPMTGQMPQHLQHRQQQQQQTLQGQLPLPPRRSPSLPPHQMPQPNQVQQQQQASHSLPSPPVVPAAIPQPPTATTGGFSFGSDEEDDEDGEAIRLAEQKAQVERLQRAQQQAQLQAKQSEAQRLMQQAEKDAQQQGASHASLDQQHQQQMPPANGSDQPHQHQKRSFHPGYVAMDPSQEIPRQLQQQEGYTAVRSTNLFVRHGELPPDLASAMTAELTHLAQSVGCLDDRGIKAHDQQHFIRFTRRDCAEKALALLQRREVFGVQLYAQFARGFGMNKDQFDQRSGIGLVDNASLDLRPEPPLETGPDSHAGDETNHTQHQDHNMQQDDDYRQNDQYKQQQQQPFYQQSSQQHHAAPRNQLPPPPMPPQFDSGAPAPPRRSRFHDGPVMQHNQTDQHQAYSQHASAPLPPPPMPVAQQANDSAQSMPRKAPPFINPARLAQIAFDPQAAQVAHASPPVQQLQSSSDASMPPHRSHSQSHQQLPPPPFMPGASPPPMQPFMHGAPHMPMQQQAPSAAQQGGASKLAIHPDRLRLRQ
jgi:hypothetical protein